jgi:hypothetical protein
MHYRGPSLISLYCTGSILLRGYAKHVNGLVLDATVVLLLVLGLVGNDYHCTLINPGHALHIAVERLAVRPAWKHEHVTVVEYAPVLAFPFASMLEAADPESRRFL